MIITSLVPTEPESTTPRRGLRRPGRAAALPSPVKKGSLMRHTLIPFLLATLLAGCGTDPEDNLGRWRVTVDGNTFSFDLDEPGWEYQVTSGEVASGGGVLNKSSLEALVFTGKGGNFPGTTTWAKLDFSGNLSETLFGTVVLYWARATVDDPPSATDWRIGLIEQDLTFIQVTN